MSTPLDKQTEILSQLWVDHRDKGYFADFFQYADLGMPLAYLIANNMVTRNNETDKLIGDTWAIFLGLVGWEDTGFESLEEVLEGTDFEDFED